ncbi:conserved hypothetical protein [Cupriavidus taiwanensis]|uniref:Uncharacterized protein n=1 Tax=Cupriavidus taiwanensis TaxID=164546 RepID=A0A375J5X5_9BURK|nr:hypothetical protein [Cupriavidus taiwanensis]SOZ17445.1 conserved hypothetical protein [Cupriavidus taiwanensis]SOZ29794.1 conserved hypothetical protein [Cupriavidus taiwanensis]SOZ46934.1 conserved hypothetical protein [Cupriavidus taiwanensis]SPA00896.1 conserved hypothetical protein [Cupriavidus taiwanensis]SPA18825.1 conserved hypothetical protein [Cupriavidus taiwanensis]
MSKIFVAGSISIRQLDPRVKARIDSIVEGDHTVIVGDANGADSSVQAYLSGKGMAQAIVYCSGPRPRNNIGGWAVVSVDARHAAPGSRAYFTAKDVEMAKAADFGLMIWDARSPGTLHNVMELLLRGKIAVVFINTTKAFLTVRGVEQLERLLSFMAAPALRKAEEKLNLRSCLSQLRNEQAAMFADPG